MSNQLRSQIKANERKKIKHKRIELRKHLNADALIHDLRTGFDKIKDHRNKNVVISLSDALMSAFAMFSLKDQSLLAFDYRRKQGGHNLRTIFGIGTIPCDTSMRHILDELEPVDLRSAFKEIFAKLQRSKVLEKFLYMEGCHLLSLDGTGYFSSPVLSSIACLEKTNKKTKEIIGYYIYMLGASIVHPDRKEVISLCLEPIIKQDGEEKNDCERNAAKRFLKDFRREHPHLPVIIIEDGLSSNAPHIRDLIKNNCHYILGAKEGDHTFLFNYVNEAAAKGETTELTVRDNEDHDILHCFSFMNDVPLNQSNQDVRVNFLEYWEINTQTGKIQHFSWVTDFIITEENMFKIMRGGRARWKIENETFNSLKNQGYNFGHNYGLGEKNLSIIFAMLLMLAFLVDQTLQLCCSLFGAIWRKAGTKIQLWIDIRSLFKSYKIVSMESLFRHLYRGGFEQELPEYPDD